MKFIKSLCRWYKITNGKITWSSVEIWSEMQKLGEVQYLIYVWASPNRKLRNIHIWCHFLHAKHIYNCRISLFQINCNRVLHSNQHKNPCCYLARNSNAAPWWIKYIYFNTQPKYLSVHLSMGNWKYFCKYLTWYSCKNC